MIRGAARWWAPVLAFLALGCGGSDSDGNLFNNPDGGADGGGGQGGSGGSSGSGGMDGGATLCESDDECEPEGKVCDEGRGECVECVETTDCSPGAVCVDDVCEPPASCENSLDCADDPAGRTVCDPATELCVECADVADCPENNECTNNQCVPFQPCTNSLDCNDGQVCDTGAGRCVDCITKADCDDGETCAADNTCRKECDSDNDCTPLGLLCDIAAGYCVECLRSDDCDPAQHCSLGMCQADVCVGDSRRCQTGGISVCTSEGSAWQSPTPCPSRTTCVGASGSASCDPWVCEAGETACDAANEKVVECSADGLTILDSTDCTQNSQICHDAACKSLLCPPGELHCNGNDLELCSVDGLSSTLQETCDGSRYCDDVTKSCQSWVCMPGSPVCDGDRATTCNAEGSGASPGGTDCSATGEVCFNGACQACAPIMAPAVPLPLDMYIMVDGTGSMTTGGGDCDIGGTSGSRWCAQINGVYNYLAQPSSQGTGVATKIWNDNSCNAFTGPDVTLQALPAPLTAIEMSFNAGNPTGSSSIEPAVNELIAYTGANETVARTMVGVLIADGVFDSCTLNMAGLASALSTHRMTTGIPTYVLSMITDTLDEADVETIAAAGGAPPHGASCSSHGTPPCHYYDAGEQPAPATIQARLATIASTAEKCRYEFPSGASAASLQVTSTPGGGGPPQVLTRVSGPGACSGAGEYFFNNAASPVGIFLCPSACAMTHVDPPATIETVQQCN